MSQLAGKVAVITGGGGGIGGATSRRFFEDGAKVAVLVKNATAADFVEVVVFCINPEHGNRWDSV